MIRSLFVWLSLASSVFAQAEIRKEKPGWADLGVRVEEADGGAVVREVFSETATKAGLKAGALLTEFDGEKVVSADQLMAKLWAMPLGKTVRVSFTLEGKAHSAEIALETIPGQKQPGMNDTVHHPPSVRGTAVEPEKRGEDAQLPAVYAFDLSVSCEWALSDGEIEKAKKMIEKAAKIFFDATEGQMYWRKVELFTGKEAWDRAHYRIRKARGGMMGGIEHVTPGGQCWLDFPGFDGPTAWIFTHEAGHMQLGSGDEYPYGGGKKTCRCIMGGGNEVELCVKDGHDYKQKESCWDNARRWYPRLKPVEKPAKGPTLSVLPEIIVTKGAGAPEEKPEGKRGYLGIQAEEPDEDDSAAIEKAGYKGGVKVRVQEGSPADKGGMEEGDIIVEFGGDKIETMEDLVSIVRKSGAGKEVAVTVLRDGKTWELKVTLGARPDEE